MVTNHVYTVAGAKGGVGKTTTSINLGASLAEAGRSTVTVELDLAMANLVDFLEMDVDVRTATTLHDVLAGEAEVKSAIYETESGLSVVPSGTDLDGYAETDLDRLPDVVETLRWHYDVVILDTPAGLSEETVRPMQLADETLLVSTPRVASIRNVRNTKELAERVDTDVRGLVLTKSGTGASPGADRISEFLDVELLGHVPEDDAVPHSQDAGSPVVSNAPKSGAAIAYRKVARQLVEEPTVADPEATAAAAGPATGSEKRPDAVSVTDVPTADGQHRGESVPPEDYGRAMAVEPATGDSGDGATGDGAVTAAESEDQPPDVDLLGDESSAHSPSDADRRVDMDSGGNDGTADGEDAPADDGRPTGTTDSDERSGSRTESDGGSTATSETTPTTWSESGVENPSSGDAESAEDTSKTAESDTASLGSQIRSLFGF
ncbi:cell division ATPase MinD [Haloarcula nitratireducens]|uniref:Cell division ATPase MinD n=1 Tax=Haloarcula nitratireducens TaxID=2487749 RepID=A0AAW4P6D4_9EURY|nr:cell division ATPase MinD [Halomicroarcula nitratireducens]MBX0293432.1 cell division ATPase MinD [Halomicroarcula nitratireducens]